MKNIKQTIIGVFAIIGVLAILTGSTNTTPQPTYGTPESHVWSYSGHNYQGFLVNAKTGEAKGIRWNAGGTKIIIQEPELRK